MERLLGKKFRVETLPVISSNICARNGIAAELDFAVNSSYWKVSDYRARAKKG